MRAGGYGGMTLLNRIGRMAVIAFKMSEYGAEFTDAAGERVRRIQQVRVDPVTGSQCRITLSRALEQERGTEKLHSPPPEDLDRTHCPFRLL